MTSQKTEYRGLAIRRWASGPGLDGGRTALLYTKRYRRFMAWVGKCIARGGAVTVSTYVVENHGRKGEAYDKLDATLDWRGT